MNTSFFWLHCQVLSPLVRAISGVLWPIPCPECTLPQAISQVAVSQSRIRSTPVPCQHTNHSPLASEQVHFRLSRYSGPFQCLSFVHESPQLSRTGIQSHHVLAPLLSLLSLTLFLPSKVYPQCQAKFKHYAFLRLFFNPHLASDRIDLCPGSCAVWKTSTLCAESVSG